MAEVVAGSEIDADARVECEVKIDAVDSVSDKAVNVFNDGDAGFEAGVCARAVGSGTLRGCEKGKSKGRRKARANEQLFPEV